MSGGTDVRRIALMFIINFYRLPYYFWKLMWLTSKKKGFSKEKKYEDPWGVEEKERPPSSLTPFLPLTLITEET